MRRQTGLLSPLTGGVRPYESLWSVINRFNWLNRPSYSEFETTFSKTKSRYFELVWDPSHPFYDSKYALDFSLLRQIGMTPARLKNAVVPPWLITNSRLRFCEACARMGYHATVFMFPQLTRCPAHRVALRSTCPACEAGISTIINDSTITAPYGCSQCGNLLIEGRRAFFEARLPEKFRDIARSARWVKHLSARALLWGDFCESMWTADRYSGEINSHLMAAMATSSQLSIPREVFLPTHEIILESSHSLPRAALSSLSADADGTLNEASFHPIYKAFLRKKAPRRLYYQQIRRIRKMGGIKWVILRYAHEFPELVTEIYSNLIFRRHCESWPKRFPNKLDRDIVFRRSPSRGPDEFGPQWLEQRSLPNGFRDVHMSRRSLHPAINLWVTRHIAMREVSGLYQEARQFSTEMVKRADFFHWPHLPGFCGPHLVVLTFDKKVDSYRLDFWRVPKAEPDHDVASDWAERMKERDLEQHARAMKIQLKMWN